MWDGLFMLLTLSTIMAIASFLAGILPLSFSLSQRQLRFITFLGTGVLVGTSLIVIIPEGIETMYSSSVKSHSHGRRAGNLGIMSVASQQTGLKHPKEFPALQARSEVLDTNFVRLGSIKAPGAIIVERTPDDKKEQAKAPKEQSIPQNGDDDSTEGIKEGHSRIHPIEEPKEPGHNEKEREPHVYVGISLILGFILMYLVDVLPEALSSAKPRYQPLHISLSDLSRGPHNASTTTLNSTEPQEPETLPPSRASATTIGLVIHACADGIALGASSTAPSTSLSLIIFLAIMLHKAPAAFGLTSVLLKQGLSKRTARNHLLLFSIAAPAGALGTWALVHLLGRGRLGGDDGLKWVTGCVLLFSGGTFLYVAMHSMNETTISSHPHDEQNGNGFADPTYGRQGKTAPTKADIAIAVVGMLLPLVTQVGHVH
ncbi:ZIP metal ion transporter-like protein [Delitschia confertaspora ATCC 74209]|uniref:ZIP metal ion transporter-like protein n=1 Tax=Delitschia confertaspora ATCC 74209 TaxID=1513339 RepID=A0A9P4JKQ6_9PLEO|nr:ZIP metal ion transporter-like protein [Delitschia confertaspora ATCC 74209]